MFPRINRWWWLLGAILGLRLISMAIVPLIDTSEPRYAEIARVMATSGDWITPWFEPGKPFWGKPPLSFWAAAASFKLFGINGFAARLPSWLATLALLVPVYELARAYAGRPAARLAVLILSTCLLPYVASGAVLTDPFLELGTTLCMAGFVLAREREGWFWRYAFFLGLAVGLLAKGPLAVVLTAGAIVPWLLLQPRARACLASQPWLPGLLLVAVLVVPWYVAAELKTPGFLRYFIIGEHFQRFVDPGWTGDRYGSAHLRPYGSIWIDWILATFPWGIVAVGVMLASLSGRRKRQPRPASANPLTLYLLAWALVTPLFFSVARNILWTYVLPALPAFAILLAAYLDRAWHSRRQNWMMTASTLAIPLVGIVMAAGAALAPNHLQTERDLVDVAQTLAKPGDQFLYVDGQPFSARYYSRGQASTVALADLPERLKQAGGDIYLAVPRDKLAQAEALIDWRASPQFQNRRYILIQVPLNRPQWRVTVNDKEAKANR